MVQHPDRSAQTAAAPPAVDIRGLRKHSLSGVDLTIARRERVAVIGKTGEGKTVLLRCVLGLLSPDSGRIHLLGKRVNRRSIATRGWESPFRVRDSSTVGRSPKIFAPRLRNVSMTRPSAVSSRPFHCTVFRPNHP